MRRKAMRPPVVSLLFFLLALSPLARADEPAQATSPAEPPEADATVTAARTEFNRGAELVKAERWSEALSAFEHAAALKPHAIATYNIAQCQRAMGQYTLARGAFLKALSQDEAASGAELPESARTEAKALLGELDKILPRVSVALHPEDAALSVDGRPLERLSDGTFVAGTLPPGPGDAPKASRFVVLMNPGAHVFTLSHRGYQDVVLNRTVPPGSAQEVKFELDRLPATIHVTSNLGDAVVHVDDSDVGNPPVDVSRNAGRYRVRVTRQGYVPYEAEIVVRPGERAELSAGMREEKRALTQKWWFWTAAGALVVGAAATTYFVARSQEEPSRPATDGGGLGWSLKVP